LVRATSAQLEGAIADLSQGDEVDGVLARGLQFLNASERSRDERAIISVLQDESSALRKFGLAAALRMTHVSDALRHALVESDDREIQDFGSEWLNRKDQYPGF